jgi:hypothetical protein
VPALLAGVAVLAAVTALMLHWYVRHRADEDDLFPVLSAVAARQRLAPLSGLAGVELARFRPGLLVHFVPEGGYRGA